MSKPERVGWIARVLPCTHTESGASVAVPEIGSQLFCQRCGEMRDVEDVVTTRPERDRRGRSY